MKRSLQFAFGALVILTLAIMVNAQNPYGNPPPGYGYPPYQQPMPTCFTCNQPIPQPYPYYPSQQYTPPMYTPMYSQPPLINPRQPLITVAQSVANMVPTLYGSLYPYNQVPYGTYPMQQPGYGGQYGGYYGGYGQPAPYIPPSVYTPPPQGMGSIPGGTFVCGPNGVCYNTINQNGTNNGVYIPGGPFVGNTINQNGTGNHVGPSLPPLYNPPVPSPQPQCNPYYPCNGPGSQPMPPVYQPIQIPACSYGIPCEEEEEVL